MAESMGISSTQVSIEELENELYGNNWQRFRDSSKVASSSEYSDEAYKVKGESNFDYTSPSIEPDGERLVIHDIDEYRGEI